MTLESTRTTTAEVVDQDAVDPADGGQRSVGTPADELAPDARPDALDSSRADAGQDRAPGSEPAQASAPTLRKPATTPEEVYEAVKGYPNTGLSRGRELFEFTFSRGIRHILECGFNHGVSSCYLAAALAAQGGGRLVTIDRAQTVAYEPGVEHFLDRLGLADLVTVFYEHTTFNWRLSRLLRLEPRPQFDLVFLDAGHTWEPTALGFLVAEKLTAPGGYILIDDINWSLGRNLAEVDWVLETPEDERLTPQVREIVELLVKPHPHIASWQEDDKWGYARKKGAAELDALNPGFAGIAQQAAEVRAHAARQFPRAISIDEHLDGVAWRRVVRDGVAANARARNMPPGAND